MTVALQLRDEDDHHDSSSWYNVHDCDCLRRRGQIRRTTQTITVTEPGKTVTTVIEVTKTIVEETTQATKTTETTPKTAPTTITEIMTTTGAGIPVDVTSLALIATVAIAIAGLGAAIAARREEQLPVKKGFSTNSRQHVDTSTNIFCIYSCLVIFVNLLTVWLF
ncbi:MAG: hypothetical protein QW074_05235 [Candidatus Caldarchaeum sp.]